jgi:enoyl-CoA hydratase/carnithine racemase
MSVFNRFERMPLPVVAAVQGLCFGGGLELALRADVIFAASGATFGHPEQTLGIVTLLGGIYRVAERAGARAPRSGP